MYILTKHYRYSLSDLESMLPWERDVYIEQVRAEAEKERTKIS